MYTILSAPTSGPNSGPTRGPTSGPTTPPATVDQRGISFPWKLHVFLEERSKGSDPSVSWLHGGRALKMHKRDVFCKGHMSIFSESKSSKYAAFHRLLNSWGFTLLTKGPDKGAYVHKFFVRGRPDLWKEAKLVKKVKRFPDSATSKKPTPNLQSASGPTSKTTPTPIHFLTFETNQRLRKQQKDHRLGAMQLNMPSSVPSVDSQAQLALPSSVAKKKAPPPTSAPTRSDTDKKKGPPPSTSAPAPTRSNTRVGLQSEGEHSYITYIHKFT
jgi:hypothetical protein